MGPLLFLAIGFTVGCESEIEKLNRLEAQVATYRLKILALERQADSIQGEVAVDRFEAYFDSVMMSMESRLSRRDERRDLRALDREAELLGVRREAFYDSIDAHRKDPRIVAQVDSIFSVVAQLRDSVVIAERDLQRFLR